MSTPGWPFEPIDTSRPAPVAPPVDDPWPPSPPQPPGPGERSGPLRWVVAAVVALITALGLVTAGVVVVRRPADLTTYQRGDCILQTGSTPKYIRKVDCATDHTDDVVELFDVPARADPNTVVAELGYRCQAAGARELRQPAPERAQSYAFWHPTDKLDAARRSNRAKVICTVRLMGATHTGSLLK